MKRLKKWILNVDVITLVLGITLIYFSESIVLWFYPLDNLPSSVLSLLMYFTLFSVAIFWAFKGLTYLTIRIYWRPLYEYFEGGFTKDFNSLSPIQKVCVSVGFYSVLLLFLATLYRGSISAL